MFNRFHRNQTFWLLLFVLLTNGTTAAQQPGWNGYRQPTAQKPPDAPTPIGQPQGNGETDYLLLRTGFLMEGIVMNEGKHYTVKTEFGSMMVPITNVEFIGKSRLEVYHFRRNLVDGSSCQDLMKLADWCANNKLVNEAVAEYARARRVAPNSALDRSILQRIESLQQQAENSEERHPLTTPSPFSSADGDDIGRWMNGMPKSIVGSFSKKVQPILTSRCAAVDCHGSASNNGFKIGIPSNPNGSTTYRNLQASLRWIDPANPSASPLLAAMVSHHGGTKPPFNVESNQYNGTIQWIQTTIKDMPTEYANQLYAQQPKKIESATALPPKRPDVPQTFFADTNQPVENSLQAPPVAAPGPTADPLDPALFNARFHANPIR